MDSSIIDYSFVQKRIYLSIKEREKKRKKRKKERKKEMVKLLAVLAIKISY